MTDHAPIETTNLDRYGSPPLEWARAQDAIASGAPSMEAAFFLCTVGDDGAPHAAAFGAAWLAGDLYFTSGPRTRKSKNLAARPQATIAARLTGIDLALDGRAERVTDETTLRAVAAQYNDGGWPCEVDGDAFTAPYSAPSAGPPPWYLYRFTFHTVTAVATAEPHGATRWRFAAG